MSSIKFIETVIKMPGMKLPVRTTLVETKNGRILLSPGSVLKEEHFKNLGEVTDIVGTNLFHCAGVEKAAKAFPKAKLWAPEGGRKLKPEINWTAELSEETWPYQDEVPVVLLKGMPKVNEAVFFDKTSRSLIVSDLCFNMTKSRGLGPWIVQNIFGTYRRFAVSRLFHMFTKDRRALEGSLKKMMALDFDRVVVSHGDNVSENGKALLRKALEERGLNLN